MRCIQVEDTTFVNALDQCVYGNFFDCRRTVLLERGELVRIFSKVYTETSSGSIFVEDVFGI